MKILLLLTLLPFFALSQTKPAKRKSSPYLKVGGGLMFSQGGHQNAIGVAGLGAEAGNHLMAGLGATIFKPAGFTSIVTPIGLDLNITDLTKKVSPIGQVGIYAPLTSQPHVAGKLYLNFGAGVFFKNRQAQGGILTINFSSFKYETKIRGYREPTSINSVSLIFSLVI